jgi:hypothetical protein
MYLFHKKHFAPDCSPLTNSLIYAGICLKAVCSWRKFLFSPANSNGRQPPAERS